MNDDQAKRGQVEKGHIDLTQDRARRDWAQSLGVTEDELKEAVRATGDSADKVRDYLKVKAFMNRLRDYVRDRGSPSHAR